MIRFSSTADCFDQLEHDNDYFFSIFSIFSNFISYDSKEY